MNTWTNVEKKQSMSYSTVVPLLAICATVGALLLAVLVGGPFARELFGVPVGFREHFTSSAAFRQALIVQIFTGSVAFLLLGAALGRKVGNIRFWTVWAANPITIGLAFVGYKMVYETLPLPHDVEYYGIRNGAALVIGGPLVFGFACLMGARLSNVRFSRNQDVGSEKIH